MEEWWRTTATESLKNGGAPLPPKSFGSNGLLSAKARLKNTGKARP